MRRPAVLTSVLGALALLFAAPLPARADVADPPRILGGTIHVADSALGPDESRTFAVSFTAQDDSGIRPNGAEVNLRSPAGRYLHVDPQPSGSNICTPVNATTSTCRFTFTVRPAAWDLRNVDAGAYQLWALVTANDWDPATGQGLVTRSGLDTLRIKRAARLTFDAFPEPPRPGRPLGMAGRLTLADWDNGGYTGAPAGTPVRLAHMADGSPHYTYPAVLETGANGILLASTEPRGDGLWWLIHDGSDSVAWVQSLPDHVDMP